MTALPRPSSSETLPVVMTVEEVCTFLRLDRRTVYSMLDAGELEGSGRGGKGRPIRIWTESVIGWARGKRRVAS